MPQFEEGTELQLARGGGDGFSSNTYLLQQVDEFVQIYEWSCIAIDAKMHRPLFLMHSVGAQGK